MRLAFLILVIPLLALAKNYTTSFPVDENPISEGGNWINGMSTGVVWSNCAVTSGLLHGTQVSGSPNFSDSTALLTGTWGATQSVSAVAHYISQSGNIQEVEVRLRSTLTANSCTGYECLISLNNSDAYLQIVRWNGPFGSFDLLQALPIPHPTGDFTYEGNITNNIITVKTNGVVACTADITSIGGTVYSSGNPGAGFYVQGSSTSGNFGFTSLTATDGQPAPPANNGPVVVAGAATFGNVKVAP